MANPPEKRVILSLEISDSAFPEIGYRGLYNVLREQYSPERYDINVIHMSDESFSKNIKEIKESIRSIRPESVEMLIINTHGMFSDFGGIGRVSENSLDKKFAQVAEALSPLLLPGSKLIFNSCLAVCDANPIAEKKIRTLIRGFGNKVNFVYASRTIELSQPFDNEALREEVAQSLNKQVKDKADFFMLDRGSAMVLGSLALSSINIAYVVVAEAHGMSMPQEYVTGSLIAFLSSSGAVFAKLTSMVVHLIRMTRYSNKKMGTNIGRAFELKDNQIRIQDIDRNTRVGLRHSLGISPTCNKLFEF